MGEIAEMMLDGTLCSSCGEALIGGPDDEISGYPMQCAGCAPSPRRARRAVFPLTKAAIGDAIAEAISNLPHGELTPEAAAARERKRLKNRRRRLAKQAKQRQASAEPTTGSAG